MDLKSHTLVLRPNEACSSSVCLSWRSSSLHVRAVYVGKSDEDRSLAAVQVKRRAQSTSVGRSRFVI